MGYNTGLKHKIDNCMTHERGALNIRNSEGNRAFEIATR